MDLKFNLQESLNAFMVLFAVIDITGLTPIMIDIEQKSGPINAKKAAFFSLTILMVFLFVGDLILK